MGPWDATTWPWQSSLLPWTTWKTWTTWNGHDETSWTPSHASSFPRDARVGRGISCRFRSWMEIRRIPCCSQRTIRTMQASQGRQVRRQEEGSQDESDEVGTTSATLARATRRLV